MYRAHHSCNEPEGQITYWLEQLAEYNHMDSGAQTGKTPH